MSQDPSKFDTGVPQPLGSGAPEAMSVGIKLRGKNQMRMYCVASSMAYTPPFLELKSAPKESFRGSWLPQPVPDSVDALGFEPSI